MKTLDLVLTHQYFDEIQAGTKRVEYRLNTPYWRRRLGYFADLGLFSAHHTPLFVRFRRGYTSTVTPDCYIQEIRGERITHPHFGPNPVEVFAIYFTHPLD